MSTATGPPSVVDATADKLLGSLKCLLVENFTIQDKTLLEKLLTSLHDADALLETIPIATHCEWFACVLDVYDRQTPVSKNASTHLYAFALKYLAILVKSNDGLVAFIETRTLQSMISRIDVSSSLKECSIFNAYVSLLQTLNTHRRGVEYVLQEGLWKNILYSIHELIVPAKYVDIQSSQYVAKLIFKVFEYEMPLHYSEPLLKELFHKLNSIDSLIYNRREKEFFAYNIYVKTLNLSLENFIGSKYESDVCENIVNKYALSDLLVNMQKLLDVNSTLLKNYMKLHLLLDCFTIWHRSDLQCILKSIFSCMNVPKNIQSYKQINNLYTQAVKYANNSNTQWAVDSTFERELIIGQLIPLKKCTEWLKCSNYKQVEFNSSSICESKYILDFCNDYNSIVNEVAISSLLNITDVVPILKQESLEFLITFFSTTTNQFLHSDYWLEQHQDSFYYKFLEILSYIFICWSKVLECKSLTDNITHNSFSVPLVHNHSEFLLKSSYSSTLLQNGLNLISTALNNRIYESIPNKENTAAFDCLCTSLNNLLLDTRPEIRDSCLQCISSLAIVSNYGSGGIFIELILLKHMSIAVLNTVKHDNDPFVRAKALECLEKMVSTVHLWEKSLKESDLIVHCLKLMQYESEGIIRRQIVKLITALFIHNKLSDELFNEICTVMVHVSIKDPLWEVKTFTYEFWSSVIKKFITKSSKPNNIETLNEKLAKLSTTGCLHVLCVALKEEHDLVVQKKAIYLTKELLVSINSANNMLDISFKPKSRSLDHPYNINDNFENCPDVIQKKSRHVDSANRILNSITTINDCELLPSLKSANISNIYPSDICLCQKTDVYTSVNDFLDFTSTYNFDDCNSKTQWIISTRCGLNSMLDDIIGQSQNCFIEGADLIDCH